MDFWKRNYGRPSMVRPEPVAKRISTPAGQRLSVIMENGQSAKDRYASRKPAAALSSPREGVIMDDFSERGSESVSGEKIQQLNSLRANRHVARRGGWWRLILIVLLFICLVIAIVLGIVFGLRTRNNSKNNSNSGNNNQSPTMTFSTAPASPTVFDASGRPENFPVGSYSMVTFLDTVQTDCTAVAETWTCFPGEIYNDSPQGAQVVFDWQITGSSSEGYRISSSSNPFSINFSNRELSLEAEGQDTEHYKFMTNMDRAVAPGVDLTGGDNIKSTCDFNSTTFSASLYTRQKYDYPSAGINNDTASYALWPYRVRVEQTKAGGADVPSCYTETNGLRSPITEGLDAQAETTLCSCLWRNTRTPNQN